MHELVEKVSVFVEKLNAFTEKHKKALFSTLSALAVFIFITIGFTFLNNQNSPTPPPPMKQIPPSFTPMKKL